MEKYLKPTAVILAAAGAINWALLSFLNYNLILKISAFAGTLSQIVSKTLYGVIAAAGAYVIYLMLTGKMK